MYKFTVNANTKKARNQSLNGVDYLVVPFVGAVHSVMNGRLVTADVLAQSVLTLNGRPITMAHPSIDGKDVSANIVDVADTIVGKVFGAFMDGVKLRGEAWFNLDLLKRLGANGKRLLELIRNGEVIETSLGWFSDLIMNSGVLNGVEYSSIVENINHDHLAVLLDEVGACNVQDGCGIMQTNEEQETSDIINDKNANKLINYFKELFSNADDSETKQEADMSNDQAVIPEPITSNDNAELKAEVVELKGLVKELQKGLSTFVATQKGVSDKQRESQIVSLVANDGCPIEQTVLEAMTDETLTSVFTSYIQHSGPDTVVAHLPQSGSMFNTTHSYQAELEIGEVTNE